MRSNATESNANPVSATALFVGDVSLDLTMVVDHVPAPDEKVRATETVEAPGGVVANAAVACARTGASVRALLQAGRDSTAAVAAALAAARVEARIEGVAGRTCRAVIIIDPQGEKRLLLDPGVSMYPSRDAVLQLDLTRIGWVHTAVYADAAVILVEKCRAGGVRWSLDLEPVTFRDGIDALAALIDGAAVVFCNDRAAAAIGGDAAARLLAFGAKAVVRTRGASGARYLSHEADVAIAAPALDVVRDTTGAGDCLAGWFIGETLAGRSPAVALQAAVTASTLSCRALGAQASYPTKTDVAGFRLTTSAAAANTREA
jgi:ribokinase